MPSVIFESGGRATTVGYSVPLPGSHTGRRTILIDLGLNSADFSSFAKGLGESYRVAAGLDDETGKPRETIDYAKARRFFRSQATAAGYSNKEIALALGGSSGIRVAPTRPGDPPIVEPPPDPGPLPVPPTLVFDRFLSELENGNVVAPDKDWSGEPSDTPTPDNATPSPALFLIEVYGISSFLGDYGMGKTVKTFTLLPGESTTIKLKTWQSTRESINRSSSIVDSHEDSARERFSNQIQTETTDKATRSSTEKWHVEAKAKASWGFGSASVKAGASGEYNSGREQFAKQAADTVQEHAQEASSKRELTVTSSAESETETGEEITVERTISNPNMRRTLNFIFRELNQAYVTKFHLKNIKIGFSNGLANSWREVSLSQLRTLLEQVLVASKVDESISKILKVAGIVFDKDDAPAMTLQKVTLTAPDQIATVTALPDASGEFEIPSQSVYYRFSRGPLNQNQATNPVDGVLMDERIIIMRTDSVLVESLLGESDSLDEYAMEIQQAAAHEKTLANKREELIHTTLEAIADPEKRAEGLAALFGPPKSSD